MPARSLRAMVSLALLSTSVAVLVAAAAPGASAATTTGYDISYPQCNGTFPIGGSFQIVGVNGGRLFTANPCLGTGDGPSELGWAGMNAGFYANTGDPGPALSSHWPNGQASPQPCNTTANPGADTAQCHYDYGWNGAADSYGDAVTAYVELGWAGLGATRTPVANQWWLDVETANSWTSTPSYNVDALQGAADYLASVGAASVGFYAGSSAWQTIAGGSRAFSSYPSWVPGAGTFADAQSKCGTTGATGGAVAVSQYLSGGFDGDARCTVQPTLAFSTSAQTIGAGVASSPMALQLSQAAAAPLTLTVRSSSAAGAFATSASGPWSPTLTTSLPSGATATPSFWYQDTTAGATTLTASASGYTNATQTERITPGALTSMTVSPAVAQVRAGSSASFGATGRDRYGNVVSVTSAWSVSPTLGTFSPNPGTPTRFTATTPGTGTITASSGSVTASASITVSRKHH